MRTKEQTDVSPVAVQTHFVWIHDTLRVEHRLDTPHKVDGSISLRVSNVRRFHHAQAMFSRDGPIALCCCQCPS